MIQNNLANAYRERIYGEQAVGVQESDFQGRTVRFHIYFDPLRVLQAGERWGRIDLYAIPFEDLTA